MVAVLTGHVLKDPEVVQRYHRDTEPKPARANRPVEIKASLADAECSERLGVPIGAPLLLIERVVYAVDGRPVEYVTTYYRADRYTYRVKLKRGPKGSGRWADR